MPSRVMTLRVILVTDGTGEKAQDGTIAVALDAHDIVDQEENAVRVGEQMIRAAFARMRRAQSSEPRRPIADLIGPGGLRIHDSGG